jgi:hypothetical protein
MFYRKDKDIKSLFTIGIKIDVGIINLIIV